MERTCLYHSEISSLIIEVIGRSRSRLRNLIRRVPFTESHKEGPVYGKIPYEPDPLWARIPCDPTSSEADCEYPLWPTSSFSMNTGEQVYRCSRLAFSVCRFSWYVRNHLLLFKNFSYQNLSLFLHSRVIISMFSVIFRFVSIFCSLFSIIFDLFYFFRSYTYKLCICFSSVLSKFFLHDVVTPA